MKCDICEAKLSTGGTIRGEFVSRLTLVNGKNVCDYCLHDGFIRAESAEARAAQLESERNAARQELHDIRALIDADKDESTVDEVTRKVNQLKRANERIGELETNRDLLAHNIDQLIKERDELRAQLEQARLATEKDNEIIRGLSKRLNEVVA